MGLSGPSVAPHAPQDRFLELSGSPFGGHFGSQMSKSGYCCLMFFRVVLWMGFVPKRGVIGKGMIYEKCCFSCVVMLFGGVVGCMLGARQREKTG